MRGVNKMPIKQISESNVSPRLEAGTINLSLAGFLYYFCILTKKIHLKRIKRHSL